MKLFSLTLLLLAPAAASAEVFLMKDGARLEGEVSGEMDGSLLIKTRYGSLTVSKNDIFERRPSAAPAEQPPAAEAAVSTAAAAEIQAATAAVVALLPPPAEPAKAAHVIVTFTESDGARRQVYYAGGVAVATETLNAAGASISLEGAIADGVYAEYYASGALKTLKPVAGGSVNGTLKTFYPSGGPQIEASYLAGAKNGVFRFFTEDGTPLMEASYVNDKLNGWKKEYAPDGTLKTEIYYADDRAADPPKAAEPPARKEEESLVTAKVTRIARGEIISFSLNGKYIGKTRLDKDFNVISQQGKMPDGAAKIYSSEGKLQKELVFANGEVRLIRVYEDGGPLKASYTVTEGKAAAFSVK